VEDLATAFPGKEQRSGIQLGHREQLELDPRHDPEAPATTSERPEQVGLVLMVYTPQPSIGGDELYRADVVGGKAVVAGVPAKASGERVADDPDGWRGTVEPSQTQVGRHRDDVRPACTGLNAGGSLARVDVDSGHVVSAQEDGVLQRPERGRSVTGPLRRDPHPAFDRELNRADHVTLGPRQRHVVGALIYREIESLPSALVQLLFWTGKNPAGWIGNPAFVRRSVHCQLLGDGASTIFPRVWWRSSSR